MNIVNKLTLRQMRLNRKRTIVTIIGTIISAAMITAVALLGLCFLDLMRRETISRRGEWHVVYQDVNRDQFQAIREDQDTGLAMMSRDLGYSYLPLSENQSKPYLFIREYNKEGFENFPIILKEGRLPQAPGEIVLSDSIYSNAKINYAIGDVLNFTIGQRYPTKHAEGEEPSAMLQERSLIREDGQVAEYLTEDMEASYKVVGIIERPVWEYTWAPGYTALAYFDESNVSEGETFDAYVRVRKVNQKLFERADRIVSDLKIRDYYFNDELLRTYGVVKDDSVRNMLTTLTVIIMGIIVIGSVSLIYNAFAISVSERSRHLGMMSSVGATRKQKRNSVFFEGAVIGAISIPIGIAAGHLGLAITFLCINPLIMDSLEVTSGFRIDFFPSAILAAFLVSAGTIFISTYIPARRASRISAIDAIRQTADVKVTRRQVKTWKLTRKLFGIEGELGLKNLKRNKKRYKATVFSLIISMLLFLVISSFTQNLKKALFLSQDGINFDIMATVYDKTSEKADIVQKILSLDGIIESSVMDMVDLECRVPVEKTADYLLESMPAMVEDGYFPYTVTLNILSSEALEEYAKKAGIAESLTAKENMAVVIDQIKYADMSKGKYVEARAILASVGDQLQLTYQGEDKAQALKPVEVAALTGDMPMGLMYHGKLPAFHILLSEETFANISEGIDIMKDTKVYLRSKEPLKLQEDLEKLQNQVGISRLSIYNVFNYRQTEENLVLLLSIFTYAFIILITAICAANILNTVSTSIALRKREFAMLKSVGITPRGFSIMLNYESIFYGIKSLTYGLPLSFAVMYLIYRIMMNKFEFGFIIPVHSVLIVVIAVFLLVGTAMLYSARKVKKENIIDALKQEII